MMRHVLPRTLRARLTILFAVSTSLLLVLSGLLLYQVLRTRLEANSAREMTSILTALQLELQEIPAIADIGANRETWYDRLHGHQSMDVAIFDVDGSPLARTNGYWPNAAVLSASVSRAPVRLEAPGSPIRFLVAMVPVGRPASAMVRVVVQYDATADRSLLRAYALNILSVIVIGTLVGAVLTWSMTRFGLRPLSRLTARAEQVSSSRLAHPLPETEMAGELKELSHAFNRMLARLDESFTRLAQFSSDLAHDMRTPLTNMLAEAQVALSQPRPADEYRAVIESGVEELQRLSRMIDNMLFLARADSAQRKLALQRVDARHEAQRMAAYYEIMTDEAGVNLSVTGQASFDGELLLVQRALSNLLSNAIAHAPRGSTVELHCAEIMGWAEVSVTDSGPGITSPHTEHIFDRFYRVDPARHNSASGTGLGLAIVKSIMEEHGGNCTVASEPHVRTTFLLRFPRNTASMTKISSSHHRSRVPPSAE